MTKANFSYSSSIRMLTAENPPCIHTVCRSFTIYDVRDIIKAIRKKELAKGIRRKLSPATTWIFLYLIDMFMEQYAADHSLIEIAIKDRRHAPSGS